jgi:hypothetical protein
MTDKLTTVPAQAIAPAQETNQLLSAIARAAANPEVDPGKMRELLQLHREITADAARVAYAAAMARLQERMPQIAKTGNVIVNGQLRSRYAKLEDIDHVLRPLLAEEGFAVSFDEATTAAGREWTCTISHREGHSEKRTLTMPVDKGAGRNDVQSIGSTATYAKRYLLSMHLNLVTRDEDDDGNGGRGPVTPTQAAHLRFR